MILSYFILYFSRFCLSLFTLFLSIAGSFSFYFWLFLSIPLFLLPHVFIYILFFSIGLFSYLSTSIFPASDPVTGTVTGWRADCFTFGNSSTTRSLFPCCFLFCFWSSCSSCLSFSSHAFQVTILERSSFDSVFHRERWNVVGTTAKPTSRERSPRTGRGPSFRKGAASRTRIRPRERRLPLLTSLTCWYFNKWKFNQITQEQFKNEKVNQWMSLLKRQINKLK